VIFLQGVILIGFFFLLVCISLVVAIPCLHIHAVMCMQEGLTWDNGAGIVFDFVAVYKDTCATGR
jgi:hypothetical protein